MNNTSKETNLAHFSSFIHHLLPSIRNLFQHQGFVRYFTNTSWLFAEKVLRLIVGLAVGVWVARYLGPEKFGLLSYAQNFVGLFSAIATLGLDGIVVRELVKDERRRDELLGTAFILKIIGAGLTLLVLAVAVNFTSNDAYTNMLVFIVASATVFQAFNVVDMYFQAKVLSKYAVFANMISLFLGSIIKIGLIIYNAPIEAFAWMVMVESVILALGYVYFYFRSNSTFNIQHLTFKRETAVSLLKDSWPLVFSGIVIMIYMRIDQVMIKEMLGSEAVGLYAAAVRISEIWYFIPTVVSSSIYPLLITAYHESEEKFYHQLKIAMGYFFWAYLLLSLTIMTFSMKIIMALYGPNYVETARILSIHIYSGIVTSMSVVFSQKYVIDGTTKVSLVGAVIGAISNVILNLWLIKVFGVYGAAIATIISYVLPTLFLGLFIDKKIVLTFIESIFYVFKRGSHV